MFRVSSFWTWTTGPAGPVNTSSEGSTGGGELNYIRIDRVQTLNRSEQRRYRGIVNRIMDMLTQGYRGYVS